MSNDEHLECGDSLSYFGCQVQNVTALLFKKCNLAHNDKTYEINDILNMDIDVNDKCTLVCELFDGIECIPSPNYNKEMHQLIFKNMEMDEIITILINDAFTFTSYPEIVIYPSVIECDSAMIIFGKVSYKHPVKNIDIKQYDKLLDNLLKEKRLNKISFCMWYQYLS